jgi:rifampicin phosphotransferase
MPPAQPQALVGGKAVGLQQLMDLGVRCPPAFCLTTAALESYLATVSSGDRIDDLMRRLPEDSARRELEALAFAVETPAALATALADGVAGLAEGEPGWTSLAVRSSALGEDGTRDSFAGLYDTVLGVPFDGVEAAVRKCWASLWSERAVTYRAELERAPERPSIAVVIQVLVPADASAVAFTRNPVTGAEDEVVVAATRGLGEPIVSGAVTPDTVIVDRETLAIRNLDQGSKQIRLDAREGGGLIKSQSAEQAPALEEEAVRALVELCLELEAVFGVPVDVEAALEGKEWHIVQARPVTAAAGIRTP